MTKVAKHLTVRQLNKLEPFNDKVKYPHGATYPDGSVPTPGTWAVTLYTQLKYYFGTGEEEIERKPRRGKVVIIPKE